MRTHGVINTPGQVALLVAEQLKRSPRPVSVACFECRAPVDSPTVHARPACTCPRDWTLAAAWPTIPPYADYGAEPDRSALGLCDAQGRVLP